MKRLISTMSGNQKGFTLIELLVVVAILGVIAAVVALNVGTFFGRGTVQAANTELHQVQTAIIALMADEQTGTIGIRGGGDRGWWAGGNDTAPFAGDRTAADYVYGPFRATYLVDTSGNILWAVSNNASHHGGHGEPTNLPGDPWSGIRWNDQNKNWEQIPP